MFLNGIAVMVVMAHFTAHDPGHHFFPDLWDVAAEHRSTGARPVVAAVRMTDRLAVSHGPAGVKPAVAGELRPPARGAGRTPGSPNPELWPC